LDAFLAAATDSGFAGTVLIARDGEIILHKAYGWADEARSRPITTQTPFWVASVSKQFTAAAILALAEDGRLRINDSITRYFEAVPVDRTGITIHRLLTHTAGLGQNYAADGIADRDSAVRALLLQPLRHPPGERFGYSNDGYNLLAAIVEIASGQSFETFLQTRLFQPAGMRQTGFWGLPGDETVAVIRRDPARARRPNWGFRGATGISSTPADLYQWYLALQANRVLTEASRRTLLAPHVALVSEGHAAYGWFLTPTPRGTTAVWTRGTEDFGHNAILMTYPEERIVIVAASNAGEREGIAVTRRLADDLAKRIFDGPASPP
jgi:CubicO group peptidase (beta-lactamase class C family)